MGNAALISRGVWSLEARNDLLHECVEELHIKVGALGLEGCNEGCDAGGVGKDGFVVLEKRLDDIGLFVCPGHLEELADDKRARLSAEL